MKLFFENLWCAFLTLGFLVCLYFLYALIDPPDYHRQRITWTGKQTGGFTARDEKGKDILVFVNKNGQRQAYIDGRLTNIQGEEIKF